MTVVGLIFGGRSVEHRVSVASAQTIARGLEQAGHQVLPLGIGPDGGWVSRTIAQPVLDGHGDGQLPPGGRPVMATLAELVRASVDVLFPTIHGTWGEDGTLQGFCEILDIPYVGANVATSAVAMDKVLCKQILQARGIPVVESEVVTREPFEGDRTTLQDTVDRCARLPFPLFVKPAIGGSSVGVSRVTQRDKLENALREALRFDDTILVERGVSGRELECAVLGYKQLEASRIGEIIPGKDFYDYEDKYLDDGAQLIAPAELEDGLEARLQRTAIEAFAAIGGSGMARVDFLLGEHKQIFVNEINTLPGFTQISMYPRLWDITGLPLPKLVDRLLDIAVQRHHDRARLDSGIKTWIASLG